MTISVKKRCEGAAVGVLAGDALLAPYENMKSFEVIMDLVKRGGLVPHKYTEPYYRKRMVDKGHPTDDAELTAALGEALDSKSFDPVRVYLALRRFIHGRISMLTKTAYGTGGTLQSALAEETYEASMVAFREGRVRVLPSNGSLMRNTVTAIRHYGNREMVIEIARRQSCITHIHPTAQVACIAHAIFCEMLLHGHSPRDAWLWTRGELNGLLVKENKTKGKLLSQDLSVLVALEKPKMPLESEMWPHIGDAMLSFRIALAAVLNTDDFRDGLTKVAAMGGDTDTYGAIAGGLMGAAYGLEGIPREWRAILQGHDKMIEIADRLYKRSKS